MKKQFTLFLCCIAFVFSGMAQYPMPRFCENQERIIPFEKFDKEEIFEQILRNLNLEGRSIYLSQTPNLYPKGMDWYEPDTVTIFRNVGNNERLICTYHNGNLTGRIYQNWKSNQWESYRKYNYKYDVQNNLTEQSYQVWQSGEWVNESITMYTYDAQKNLKEESTHFFNAPVEKTRWTYTYDERNNVTNRLFQVSYSNNQWDRIYEYTNTYDMNNNLIICECFAFIGDLMGDRCGWRETCVYDAQNNLVESFFQVLLCENWQWIDASKSNYTYDEQNNLIELLTQSPVPWQVEWGKSRSIYTYDIQNNRIEDLWQQWESDQWLNLKKRIYSYDVISNLQEDFLQVWESNQWKNNSKTNYTYDERNNGNIVFYQHWKNNTWVDSHGNLGFYYNNMLSSCNYGLLGSPCYRLEISYTKTGNVSIQENHIVENYVKLYPNPISNILFIETGNANIISKIKIYSIEGILLINTQGNQIDVSSLSSGIYIAEVDGVCRKIVKQ
ncbi:MAG: T9SS type A sorting domain-containing protein [Bacteroidetes bacterium]|nr:T9SS type A sorting domain-containing protein [Bacteroidota bacterium]MCL2302070.1 T9SS type A sorting domain-containing protein [Lentimicrobiaceae bacterium]